MNGTTKKHDTHITHIHVYTCIYLSQKIWTRVKSGPKSNFVDQNGMLGQLFLGSTFFLIYQPDQHTLVLPHSPEGDVDLIGDGVDVRWFLTQLCVLIFLHQVQAVYTLNLLVGVHRTQDGANVGLREGRGGGREGGEGRGREGGREGGGRREEGGREARGGEWRGGEWRGGENRERQEG